MDFQKQKRELMRKLADTVSDRRVLDAMRAVPRERFVPPELRDWAYDDYAMPIDAGQSVSQPTIVAMTLAAMEIGRFDRVLEVGTGSGYQAALLAELAREVVTVERVPRLARAAEALLAELGCDNVRVLPAGARLGWADGAPYDAIAVAAAAPSVPPSLVEQLKIGGRLIVPVGSLRAQELVKAVKTERGFSAESLTACRFVPLIGHEGWSEEEVLGYERRDAGVEKREE